jgi:hypothetical protein
MAPSKSRSKRTQPSQQREADMSSQPQQQRSSDRRPREQPNRRNVEAPVKEDRDRNPSVNQPMEDEPPGSQRPGGIGDTSR